MPQGADSEDQSRLALKDILTPLPRSDERRTAQDVYDALQACIISGRIAPGAVLPQAEVARLLNVSRTPVREAMRMLQEAGLLVGEPNYRHRVVLLDPVDIEAVFSKLVVLEGLAVTITVSSLTEDLARKMYATLDLMAKAEAQQQREHWRRLTSELHDQMTCLGGESLVNDIKGLRERTQRYQIATSGFVRLPPWMARSNSEYRKAVDSMCAREGHQAAGRIARNMAASGHELIQILAPGYDATKLKAAVSFASFGCDLPPYWVLPALDPAQARAFP